MNDPNMYKLKSIAASREEERRKKENSLLPHGPLVVPTPAHDQHLEALDPIPQCRVLLGQGPVLLLQVGDVLGGLAQDGGLVQLVGRGNAAEVVVGVEPRLGLDLVHDAPAVVGVLVRVLKPVDHDAQGRDRVAEGGDLVVEVGAVPLLDHVVGRLLGPQRGLDAAGGRLVLGGGGSVSPLGWGWGA